MRDLGFHTTGSDVSSRTDLPVTLRRRERRAEGHADPTTNRHVPQGSADSGADRGTNADPNR
jgi:hypothetical protein